eukprot:scaffold2542_cov140-Skeletonema_menzelii.AAC.3
MALEAKTSYGRNRPSTYGQNSDSTLGIILEETANLELPPNQLSTYLSQLPTPTPKEVEKKFSRIWYGASKSLLLLFNAAKLE